MPKKIAIIGAGWMAAYHVAGFRAGGAEVVAIVDKVPAAATAASQKYGVDKTFAEPKELFAAIKDLDAVSIITPNVFHHPLVMEALAAGKHVFCEKPLCRTLDEMRAIVRARGDRHLGCNLILRAAPLYRWLRAAIRDGELGEIYAVDGDYLYGRLAKITDGWRGAVDDYSVFQGGGVHLLDLMMWLLGERPARVAAVGNRIVTRDTGFRYPDFVAATY